MEKNSKQSTEFNNGVGMSMIPLHFNTVLEVPVKTMEKRKKLKKYK